MHNVLTSNVRTKMAVGSCLEEISKLGGWRGSIVADPNSTVLGFRTLQRHGYQVFSGIEPHLINKSLPVDIDC